MQKEAKRRLPWIRLYEETHDVGLVCRHCGISGPTLRKWLRRYEEQGETGLVSQSRRPKTSPQRKVYEQEEARILELRRERNFGARRIQQEMLTEFYATTTMDSPGLEEDLRVWVLDCNYRRVHGSLGKTPMQRCAELLEQTPLSEEVAKAFDPVKEIIFVDRLTLRRRTFTANRRTKK